MDQFNTNVEELCKFQGKFTPEDDEMNPNFKVSKVVWIKLNQRKDEQCLPRKGDGEPTVIITEAKKHLPLDDFCNQYQTYDMEEFIRNFEELCSIQGKFTPEDDEMNPNFKVSKESKLKTFWIARIKLNQRKDEQYLPRKGDGEPTVIITEAKKHLPLDDFCNQYQTYDTDEFSINFEDFCSFQGKFTPEDDEMNPNFKALSESKLKRTHLSVSEEENNPNQKT
ncbi:hypothetical protein TNCV_5121041 [Trichonephila clavipes]|nr:hypothetical protein TNCV_5121041 [Trichonephila clavipes]